MRKRILSIILVLVLCLAYVPVQVHAAEVTEITVTGLTNKYRTGDLISVDLGGIDVNGNGEDGINTDGKSLMIDGVEYLYPWDTSLIWEAGVEYILKIPMSVSMPDTLSDNVTCTVDGETVPISVNSSSYTTLYYRIYAASSEAAATVEPTAKDFLSYRGRAQALVDAGTTNDGTMQYKLMSSSADWSSTVPTATEVGTYEITWRIKGDNSHLNYESPTPIMVYIDKAEATVKANNLSKTVGEDDPTLTATVSGVYGSDSLVYTVVREAGEDMPEDKIVRLPEIRRRDVVDYDVRVHVRGGDGRAGGGMGQGDVRRVEMVIRIGRGPVLPAREDAPALAERGAREDRRLGRRAGRRTHVEGPEGRGRDLRRAGPDHRGELAAEEAELEGPEPFPGRGGLREGELLVAGERRKGAREDEDDFFHCMTIR